MKLNTAISANVLLEDHDRRLTTHPVTLHLSACVQESLTQYRERVFAAVEEHYRSAGRVVSLTILEQAKIGKRAVSMRRDPLDRSRLEVCDTIRTNSGFRLGGAIVDMTSAPVALH